MAAFVGSWTSATFLNNTGGSLAGRTSTAGNFVAITGATNNAGTTTYSHSQAGSVQVGRAFENNGNDDVTIRYIENIVGGASHTITVTTAAGSYSSLNASEYSGMATSSSLDKSAVGTGLSTSLLTAATATTTQAAELLIGSAHKNYDGSTGPWTAGASYTLRGNNADTNNGAVTFLEDRIVSSTGAYTASATWGGSSNEWVCQIATFKAASAAAGIVSYGVTVRQAVRRAAVR